MGDPWTCDACRNEPAVVLVEGLHHAEVQLCARCWAIARREVRDLHTVALLPRRPRRAT